MAEPEILWVCSILSSESDIGYVKITFSCGCEWSGRRAAGGGTVVRGGRPASAISQTHRSGDGSDSTTGTVDALEIVVVYGGSG
ncbi:hypothetical protein L1887_21780 [Cichorium endivia]|nr:hypothetical protein L1887_21780 [Cichorium endivia]